jgi:hypothetical protein
VSFCASFWKTDHEGALSENRADLRADDLPGKLKTANIARVIQIRILMPPQATDEKMPVLNTHLDVTFFHAGKVNVDEVGAGPLGQLEHGIPFLCPATAGEKRLETALEGV